MYDKIESNLRSLRAIGIQGDTYVCVLVPMLKNKLPKETNLLLSRKFDPQERVMGNRGNNEWVKNWVRSQRTLLYREGSQIR